MDTGPEDSTCKGEGCWRIRPRDVLAAHQGFCSVMCADNHGVRVSAEAAAAYLTAGYNYAEAAKVAAASVAKSLAFISAGTCRDCRTPVNIGDDRPRYTPAPAPSDWAPGPVQAAECTGCGGAFPVAELLADPPVGVLCRSCRERAEIEAAIADRIPDVRITKDGKDNIRAPGDYSIEWTGEMDAEAKRLASKGVIATQEDLADFNRKVQAAATGPMASYEDAKAAGVVTTREQYDKLAAARVALHGEQAGPCPDCGGTGEYVGLAERRPCPTCKGGRDA